MTLLRTRVALNSIPSSETYQAQNAMALSEIVKSMPEELRPALMGLVVRAHQIKDGEEVIELIRQATGFGPEPDDPAEREALQGQRARAGALQERLQQVELLEREAEAKTKLAAAELDRAKARKLLGADTELTEAKAEHEIAKARAVEEESDRADVEQQRALIETGANIIRDADAPDPARTSLRGAPKKAA